jgi:hypothetical protein
MAEIRMNALWGSDRVRRRDFITLLSGAAAWPLAARAQQPKMLRVGFVGMQPREAPHYTNFLRRMGELGYQEGRNFTFDYIQTPNVDGYDKSYQELARASPTCSLQWETSRRYVPRFPPRTVSRSRSWPSISILLRRVMSRICHNPAAM